MLYFGHHLSGVYQRELFFCMCLWTSVRKWSQTLIVFYSSITTQSSQPLTQLISLLRYWIISDSYILTIFITKTIHTQYGTQSFIPIPKKGNAKESSNYRTTVLISHASKVMLKILQVRLQQYVNCELPDVQAGFRKGRRTREQIANIRRIIEIARKWKWSHLVVSDSLQHHGL